MTQLDQQLARLTGLRRFDTIKPGLETTTRLLAALGNPHQQFQSVHIAGTNGKGSTATFLGSILQQTGSLPPTSHSRQPKTGLYTSPYVHNFNERMQVNSIPVTDLELAELITQTQKAAAQHQLDPTFFEFATAVAFLHFANQDVDTAVVEVGMGGALDATNVITPAISIITNIGLDHTEWLGTTNEKIAEQKAGIIKEGVPVVTAETDPDILEYFAKVCRQKNAALYAVNDHLVATVTKRLLTSQTFTTRGVINDTFTIPLLGEHQVTNALTALLAWHVISPLPSLGAVHDGLAKAFIPGRLEIVSKNTFILVMYFICYKLLHRI